MDGFPVLKEPHGVEEVVATVVVVATVDVAVAVVSVVVEEEEAEEVEVAHAPVTPAAMSHTCLGSVRKAMAVPKNRNNFSLEM